MSDRRKTLVELLSDEGFPTLKSYQPGKSERFDCFRCHGGTQKERRTVSVIINEDGRGAVFHCYRATCGWKGFVRIEDEEHETKPPPRVKDKPIRKPEVIPAFQTSRPDWMYRFFSDRNIGAFTVDQFGCYSVEKFFSSLRENRPAIVFPYLFNGEPVNRKYRAYPEKQMMQEKDPLPTLFNIDRISDEPKDGVIWVEGEIDVMALFECGYKEVVSLKDGAPTEAKFRTDDKRFEALRTHAERLHKIKKFILAGDMDGPGLALREELARRLGRHRCWLVQWPEGCKDASDVLRLHGPEAVTEAINEAELYPIDGLQRVTADALLNLREHPPPRVMTTGVRTCDAVLKLPTEGRLIVVTGIPSHGKTAWTRFVMVHTAKEHDRKWLVFSPEMQPWEHFAAECAEVLVGKPFWPVDGIQSMTPDEIGNAGFWFSSRMTMMVCDSETQAPTMSWLLERAAFAALRDGITDWLIDPWNEVEHQRGEMNETDYIGRCLQQLKAFALRHGTNVWVICHPAKPFGIKPGEEVKPPGPYDIASSAHWANKTDLGLTVHSRAPGTAELILWKARFRRFGKRGSVAQMEYDELTGIYKSPVSADLPPVEPPWGER
jgi:twinkle protein